MMLMEEEEEGAAEWIRREGEKERERERETRLHSWEMRMVTMATAAESHMMQRSAREERKERLSERVGSCQQTTEEERREKRW